jgi:hypothetical protein
MAMKLKLCILDGSLAIHHFNPNTQIPTQVFESAFYSITRTAKVKP